MFDEILDGEDVPAQKIIFTGLDNSGKTTILLALQRSLMNLATLAPTKMVDRSMFEYLDYKIATHDLGGQKKYLINYLKQPGKYFADTSAAVYVIDLIDLARFDESISYFKDALSQFEELEIEPYMYVFFHKAEKLILEGDPGDETLLEGSMGHNVHILQEKMEKINNGRFDIEYKTTTVFDPWTITSAFSDLMLKLFPQSVLLDKTLAEFGQNSNLDALLLLDSHSLTLGTYYKDEDAKKILTASTPYFLTLLDSWKPYNEEKDKKKMKVMLNNYDFLFTEILDEDGKPTSLYFLAMTSDIEIESLIFDDFSKIILGILNS